MRAAKVCLERQLWSMESTLEEEQFKRDKVELKHTQLRREMQGNCKVDYSL